jgi:hypothetical protein
VRLLVFRTVAGGVASGALLFGGVMHVLAGFMLSAAGLLAAAVGVGLATVMFWRADREWVLPDWSRPFEVQWTEQGLVLRCNRCDQVVLPWTQRATQPRLLSYSHHHAEDICGAATAVQPGDVTDALGVSRPSRRPWSRKR